MNQMTNNTSPSNQNSSGDFISPLSERVKKLIFPPIFPEDEAKTRQASILNTLLLTALIVSTIYSFSVFLTSNQPLLIASLIFAVQILIVISLILIRRGFVQQTGRFITILFWLFIAVISVLYGTVINPVIPTFIIVIFAAGIIINNRAAVSFTILTIIFYIILLVLDSNNLIPQTLVVTPINFVLRITFNAIMAAFFIFISNRSTSMALNQLMDTRERLLQSNQELSEIQTYLQETVAQRTDQLEKRTRYLEAASQVAKQSLSTFNLQEMLDNIAILIGDQFGFYHVGIFLLDDRGEWAVLRAASSPGGKQMIARNHRLEVGKQGIVGFVTGIGQARISQDIELDRIHSVTLELPDTRAEMALPLIARNKMIGALDIQDSNPNVFSEDDIPVLQTVADQIALAVENIRLYQQTQESLEEIQRVYGEYTQQAWFETYQKNLLRSYRYSSGAVETIPDSEYIQPIGNKVSVPIQIRGYNIGAIEISKEESPDEWTDDELRLLHTLSEQLGIALDSARLYNETQLRASTEHAISQISSDLWENMDINSILKTAAQKLRETLAVPEVTVRLTQPAIVESQNGNKEEHIEIAEEEIEE